LKRVRAALAEMGPPPPYSAHWYTTHTKP
jgi:hypothetical protein